MHNLLYEFKNILFQLLKLVILIPIFAYGMLCGIENLEKAWKSGSHFKKWLAITTMSLFLAIVLGFLL